MESVTTDLPPVVNRTGSDCFYSCSFNDRSSSEYIQIEVGQIQPCVYMVEVTRVFKGNNTVSIILTRLKNIKNVKGCRDGMPKSMQTR